MIESFVTVSLLVTLTIREGGERGEGTLGPSETGEKGLCPGNGWQDVPLCTRRIFLDLGQWTP